MAAKLVTLYISLVLIINVSSLDSSDNRKWESIGPEILKSKIIPPLFNQTSPGCWLGNQFYMVGDRWSPVVEPHGLMACVKCQCAQIVKKNIIQLNGRVVCKNIKKECPVTKCQTPIRRSGTCCAVCPGEDTSFEDSFHTDKYVTTPDYTSFTGGNDDNDGDDDDDDIDAIDMTAVLVGGGKQNTRQRSVRTRAVAMIHLYDITSESFNYAIRFSKLNNPTYFKITDEYGTTLVEERLPRQKQRSGRIYGKVNGIENHFIQYIIHHPSYVVITTSRNRKGEIIGKLRHNTMARIVTFEALLNPSKRSGTGALVTFYYDVISKMASFVIQMEGLKYSKITSGDYFVTLEKDTEILHQNMLQLSKQKNQLVGKVPISSRWSKQIARGRMQVRVTSRTGDTMKGVLRPRLLRQDLLSMINDASSSMTGFVLLSVLENGTLLYKVQSNVSHEMTTNVILQRPSRSKTGWKDFCVLTKNITSDKTENGIYKRFRARDIVLLLNVDVRVKMIINDRKVITSDLIALPKHDQTLFEGQSVIMRSTNCDSILIMIYDVTKECSRLTYHILSPELQDNVRTVTVTLDSMGGRVTHRGSTIAGSIGRLNSEMYHDLNDGNFTVHLSLSDGLCDQFIAEIQLDNKCWMYDTTSSSTDISHENDFETNEHSDIFSCFHEGKFYTHAQSWTPDSSCVTCTCIRGNVNCDEMLCPTVTCKHPVQRDNECCPVCIEDNETERKFTGSCYFEGDKRWYKAGSTWYPYVPPFGYSKCAMCTCDAGSLEVNCTRLPCPELTCPKSQRIRLKIDDCCQVCKDNDRKSNIGNPSIIVRTNSMSVEECSFGGVIYNHGDKWHPILQPFGEMKCYTCSCKNGKSRCRKKKCQPLDCRHQYRPSGQCCPVCSESRSTKPRYEKPTEFDLTR